MKLNNDKPLDQPARDLISKSGLNQTLFVEAGAGTGKTTQLVTRIVNLVIDNQISLADVAAITFTEAAAAELQSRIRIAFEVLAADPDSSEKVRVACHTAIGAADLAAISTVHGFANRILREFSVAAGLPPRVTILDEIGSQLANERRWDRFVDTLHANPDHNELLTRLAIVNVPLSPTYLGQPSFKDVASSFNQNWDRLDTVVSRPARVLTRLDFSEFDAAVAELERLPELCSDPSDKFLRTLEDSLLPSMRAVVQTTDPYRKLRALAARTKSTTTAWKAGSGGTKANWGAPAKQFRDQAKAINDVAKSVVGAVADELIDQLQQLTAVEVREAAKERQANGGLEFHDLLVLARDVLRTSSEVRSVLNDRYQAVLLDEFQDTDPIQIEVASLIAATKADSQPQRWQDHTVEEGRLFFVGDAKQSIYRFRRADIELFLNARDRYSDSGPPVQLTTNFRTVSPIIDWVNGVFAEIMPEEIPAAQPKYDPLVAWRSPSEQADHRPIMLGGPHPNPKVRAPELRELEATDVAAIIRSVRDSPDAWPIGVGKSDWRPATLSDVTILIPTRTSLPYLRNALEASDIPYRLATGTLVYDTQEVRDALAVLRSVDDPTDVVSLVAALRSPLFGCSDVDLFEFKTAGGRWDIRRQTPGSLGEDHPVSRAIAQLNSWWRERWWSGPAQLLGQILAECRANLLAFGQDRPAEVWRRLRFLADQARMYEETTGADLRGFVDWASMQSADGARVHEPLLPETDDDAVKISTVHGAKGLEFPITILSGMTTASKSQPRSGVNVLWNDDGQPEVKIRKDISTIGHEPRADFEAAMDTHEKMRLLYVAATRARDHLVVSTHYKDLRNKDGSQKDPETYAAKLARFCADNPDVSQSRDLPELELPEAQATVAAPTAPPLKAEVFRAQAEWRSKRNELVDKTSRATVWSATAVARSVAEASEAAAIIDQDDDGSEQDVTGVGTATAQSGVRRKGRAGSAIGTAVHNTLEYVDFANPTNLADLVRRQCDLELIPEHYDTVLALTKSALGSEAIALAVANKAFKELYVAASVGDVTIEGYIDLLVQTPDGLVVIDYKTDAARTDAEIDKKLATYELQAASYAVALEETTGMTVTECRFVFCNTKGAIERNVANLFEAKQRVRDVVSGQVSREAS